MKPRTGCLYKRWAGRRLRADSKIEGIYYLRWKAQGIPTAICLHTKDRGEAERLRADHMGRIAWGDREKYLKALIQLGEQSKRELQAVRQGDAAVLLKDAWTRYLASKRRPNSGEATLRAYKGQYDRLAKWAPQTVKYLADMTGALAERYVDELDASDANSGTVNKHVGFLRLMWKTLDPAAPNPWGGLHSTQALKVTHHRRLSLAECKALIAAATGEWRTLLIIGYSTGLRLFDAANLDWTSVKLAQRCISVVPRKTARKKPEPLAIPIMEDLYNLLRLVPARRRQGPVLPAIAMLYRRDSSAVSKRLGAIFTTAAVLDTPDGQASFHSFRVTMQSTLDQAAVHRVVSRSILGHSGAGMSDTYSRLDVAVKRKAMRGSIRRLVKRKKKGR